MEIKKWSKDLIMTFIGTTLSIVLTFGTAHVINTKQQRADGRKTAIMVIRDIENTSAIFREYKDAEEAYYEAARYIDSHFDRLESISKDTMGVFLQHTTTSPIALYHYDDSSEKIFQNSPEAWKNIGNSNFVDAVHSCYHIRKLTFDRISTDPLFARPVPYQEWYEMLFDNEMYSKTVDVQFARKYLRTEAVQRYLDYSVVRRQYLADYADQYMNLANRCKFILGITDEEIEAYEAQKERLGKRLKANKLVGKWCVETGPEKKEERIYGKDHSYENTTWSYSPYSLYVGKVTRKRTMRGTWDIQGDSLIVLLAPEYEYEIDRSQISYTPDKEEAVNALLDYWDQGFKRTQSEVQQDGEQRYAYFVSIDPSGDKIETHTSDDTGVQYMTRVKE